jgi:hypothetical protein
VTPHADARSRVGLSCRPPFSRSKLKDPMYFALVTLLLLVPPVASIVTEKIFFRRPSEWVFSWGNGLFFGRSECVS